MYSLALAFVGFPSVFFCCGDPFPSVPSKIDRQLLRTTGARWLRFVALALRSSCLPVYVTIIEIVTFVGRPVVRRRFAAWQGAMRRSTDDVFC